MAYPLEGLVGSLPKSEYHIAGEVLRRLFTFSREYDGVAIGTAFFDGYFESLALSDYLVPMTFGAVTLSDGALALAPLTGHLHLHRESHSSLHVLHPDSMSRTLGTLL